MLARCSLTLSIALAASFLSAPRTQAEEPRDLPKPTWSTSSGGARLEHVERGLSAVVDGDALTVVSSPTVAGGDAPAVVRVSTTRFGRVDASNPVGAGALEFGAARVALERDAFTEWFEAAEHGIEQGWTIHAAPEGRGALWIGLAFEGLRPKLAEDGRSAFLVDDAGRHRLRYSGLFAKDANGVELDARLRLSNEGLGIAVDDARATYPILVDPVLSGLVWTFTPNSSNARLSVGSTAGDVNGDGYGDLIAASPTLSRAWIFHGSASGLATTPTTTLNNPPSAPDFGTHTTCLGDIDGDGYDDVAVGAPSASIGSSSEGAVFVYRGSATGVITTPHWTLTGGGSNRRRGIVQYAGDVNGDGRDDVLVGEDRTGTAATAVLYAGSTSALPGAPIWTVSLSSIPSSGMNRIGAISGAGDVNADGFDDLLLGLPAAASSGVNPRVLLFLGNATGAATSPVWQVQANTGPSHETFGSCVRPLGDLQGDGYADFCVGDPSPQTLRIYLGNASGSPTLLGGPGWSDGFGPITAGDVDGDGLPDFVAAIVSAGGGSNAQLYRGSPSGFIGSPTTIIGPGGSAQFGTQAGAAGDVNGDGRADVFVTAPRYSDSHTDEGGIFVYFGEPTLPPLLVPTTGTTALAGSGAARFGSSISMNGDVNGDGRSDLLVGAPSSDAGGLDSGSVALHRAGLAGLESVAGWSFPTSPTGFAGHEIGASAALAGDVNNDGFGDVLVGAPGTSNGQANEGRAYLFYGNASGAPSTLSGQFWFFESNELDAEVGRSVASAGDVNGDGYVDVLVGAPGRHLADLNRGAVFVFHGSATGLPTTPSLVLSGPLGDTRFGAAVACAGDVNRDGYSDVIVGAPNADDGAVPDAGAAYLFVGSATGLIPTPASIGRGAGPNAAFGAALASAGDVDRDGYADLVVGAPFHQAAAPTGGGRVTVHRGGSGPAPDVFATTLRTFDGGQANAEFGASVGGIGDLDADGYSDLVLAAPRHDGVGADSGRLLVYLGSSTGPAAAATQTLAGGATGVQLGGSVATAGDWNGDGFSDLVAAQPGLNGNDGGCLIYIGSTTNGYVPRVQQRRVSASTALDRLCLVDSTVSLYLDSTPRSFSNLAATVAGRERVGLEWELKDLVLSLDGSQIARGPQVDSGPLAGAPVLHELASGLVTGRGYSWRSRQRTGNPYFAHTPWRALQGNGLLEKKLGTGFDCNGNGIEDGAETAANPALDCNGNHVPDTCDIATGADPDCDNDGVPNSCELFANDCDGDELPDDCELATGGPDCNGNLVLDGCDIAGGASLDANGDQVPDECEFLPYCFGDGTGSACPCANFGAAGRGCANSVNAAGAVLTVTGVPQIFGDTIVLHGAGMPNSVSPSAIYLQGTLRDNGGLGTPLNDGLRCVTGSLVRLGTKPNSGGASQYPDVGNPSVSVRGAVPSGGGTYHYQVFYRNAAAAFCPPGTANWTNAISIVWRP
ncbi:MAG: VCBS repeat-containing protein [Planctomycetes bacterium]|nr:VCBS repeat-containing protein [Planctomycetota bacterium]